MNHLSIRAEAQHLRQRHGDHFGLYRNAGTRVAAKIAYCIKEVFGDAGGFKDEAQDDKYMGRNEWMCFMERITFGGTTSRLAGRKISVARTVRRTWQVEP